jgi:peptide/nickel transport system permease protein
VIGFRAARKEPGAVTAYIVGACCTRMPILIGVNALTFVLFFVVNSPDDMARMHLGEKRVTDEAILSWKRARLRLPLIFNSEVTGSRASPTRFLR